jgi:hypothetical protein
LFDVAKKFLPYSENSVDFSFSNQTSFETLSKVKHFLGNFVENSSFGDPRSDLSENYLFNTLADRIEESDIFLVLGTNLRFDAPLLNIKLRKILRNNPSVKIFSAGSTAALSTTYPIINLGDLDLFWSNFFRGKHKLSKYFYKTKTPCVIINSGMRNVTNSIQSLACSSSSFNRVQNRKTGWFGLNFLSLDAYSNSLYDLSLNFSDSLPNLYKGSSFTSLYNFGNDNLVSELGSYDFITYQGHHGDLGASTANLIIPVLHPYESSTTSYLNAYGDFQFISKVRTFGQSVLDSSDALGYISERLGTIKTLNPSWFSSRNFTITDYSFRITILRLVCAGRGILDPRSWLLCNPLNSVDAYSYRFGSSIGQFLNLDEVLSSPDFDNFIFKRNPANPRYFSFYLTDSSTRASHIMALSQSRFKQSISFYN